MRIHIYQSIVEEVSRLGQSKKKGVVLMWDSGEYPIHFLHGRSDKEKSKKARRLNREHACNYGIKLMWSAIRSAYALRPISVFVHVYFCLVGLIYGYMLLSDRVRA